MDIKTLALLLLIGRLCTVVFVSIVLMRQWELFRFTVYPGLVKFRRNLFILSLIIMGGQFVPILIDVLAVFANYTTGRNPSPIGVAYAVSSNITMLLSAILIWTLYRMAADEKISTDQAAVDEKIHTDQEAVDEKIKTDKTLADSKRNRSATIVKVK